MSILLNLLCVLAAAAVGGVLGRCGGGFIGLGRNMTNPKRWLWCAMPDALLFTALHAAKCGSASIGLFAAVFMAAWLGQLGIKRFGDTPGGHGWCQGRGGKFYDAMCCIGLYRMGLLAIAIHHWLPEIALWLPFCAVLLGLGYCLGWELLDGRELIKWRPRNPNADDGSGFDHFAISGGEWGEVLARSFLWAAYVTLALPWS